MQFKDELSVELSFLLLVSSFLEKVILQNKHNTYIANNVITLTFGWPQQDDVCDGFDCCDAIFASCHLSVIIYFVVILWTQDIELQWKLGNIYKPFAMLTIKRKCFKGMQSLPEMYLLIVIWAMLALKPELADDCCLNYWTIPEKQNLKHTKRC